MLALFFEGPTLIMSLLGLAAVIVIARVTINLGLGVLSNGRVFLGLFFTPCAGGVMCDGLSLGDLLLTQKACHFAVFDTLGLLRTLELLVGIG